MTLLHLKEILIIPPFFIMTVRTFFSGYSLGFFEKKYKNSTDFLRIHKSTIINKNYLKSVEIETKNGYVQLINGKRFEVSRRRIQVLEEYI